MPSRAERREGVRLVSPAEISALRARVILLCELRGVPLPEDSTRAIFALAEATALRSPDLSAALIAYWLASRHGYTVTASGAR